MQFKKIYIEITNLCNLKCSFCPPTVRKPKVLSVDEFEVILKKIKGHTNYIYLHVKGEPLSHPEFNKIIYTAYKMGFFINITTNGTLINRYSEMLSKSMPPRQINFSLHSFSSNLNNLEDSEQLNNLKEYLKTIINFTKLSLATGKTYISYRLWNYNSTEGNDANDVGNKAILKVIQDEFNLDYDPSSIIVPGKALKIADRFFINSESEFIWPNLKNESLGSSGICHGLKDHIAILSNGTVVPCCLDGDGIMPLGNILVHNLSTILNSKKATAIRNGFENRIAKEELCQKCQFKSKF